MLMQCEICYSQIHKGVPYMIKQVDGTEKTPKELIDERIEELSDWRGEMLSKIRKLIIGMSPEIVEEWKWRGTPVWYLNGIICTGETYKSIVKLTFAKGALLNDPAKLFNSSLDGNVRRAIDIHEDEAVDEVELKQLIQEAIDLNKSKNKTDKMSK